MAFTLAELAERFDLELHGSGAVSIHGVAAIATAGPQQLSFVSDSGHRKKLGDCRAAALLLKAEDLDAWQGAALVSNNPHADFARIAALFDPAQRPSPGVHPAAWVDETAILGKAVSVGPGAVIEAGAAIGDDVVVGPGCVIGRDVQVGAGSWLTANVTLHERVTLGERVHAQPGAVVGGRGFGLAADGNGWLEVPQLGSVRIGNDVEIGANTCIDRGAFDNTVIEDGVKIDNLVQVGHNTHIGAHTAIAGCVGIAGSVRIGARCQIGGGVGVADHVCIADDVVVTGFSLVASDIGEAGLYSSGLPVAPAREWRRQVARLRQIDDLAGRVKALEKIQQTSGRIPGQALDRESGE